MGYPRYVAYALRLLSGIAALYFLYKGLAGHDLPALVGLDKPSSEEPLSSMSKLGFNITLLFHWLLGVVCWGAIGIFSAFLCIHAAAYIEAGIPELVGERQRAEEAEARLVRIERQLERRRAMRIHQKPCQDSESDRSNDKSLAALLAGIVIGGFFF